MANKTASVMTTITFIHIALNQLASCTSFWQQNFTKVSNQQPHKT